MTINIDRPAWRNVAKFANDLNTARRLAENPMMHGLDAQAVRSFKLAMDDAPPLVKLTVDGENWSTLEVLGVKQSMVGPILEALGASEPDIAKAVDDPNLAWDLIVELGAKYRSAKND